MSAREELLARIRQALAGAEPLDLDVPRPYRRGGEVGPGDPASVERFVERSLDYRAGVRRATVEDLAGAIGAALSTGLERRAGDAGEGAPRIVVPPGVERAWLRATPAEVHVDDGLDATELDGFDAVVTAAAVAIAETGTIVLDGSPDQGRRALTLVPDVHVCVVRAGQIVATVPDAMPRLDPTRPLTWISGPSATSDIELERVEGVHGPRVLEIVVVDPA